MKKQRRRSSIKVGKGRILETSHNTYMAYMRSNGKRYRKCFDSFNGAEQYLESLHEQSILPPLTSTQNQDARIAFSKLPPNIRLRDVVDYYLANTTTNERLTLSELIARYFEYNSVRPITIRNHTTYKNRMIEIIGDKEITTYTSAEINSLVKQYPLPSQQKCLSCVSAWFSFALKHKLVSANPCEKIPKPQLPERQIQIYSVDEAQKILNLIEEKFPRLAWYFAVGFFAGVRPHEMLRLKQSNFRDGYIYLNGDITKTASTRSVTILDNLKQWLEQYPFTPIDTKELRVAITYLRKHVRLIQDGMRHSYASYSYEMTHNATLVASELGHAGTNIFFKHYRALADPQTGARFFSILPKKVSCLK